MPRELTQDERDELTPAELEAIMHAPAEGAETATAAAATETDDDETGTPAEAATTTEAAPAAEATTEEVDPAALAAVLEDDEPTSAPAAQLPQYSVGSNDYTAKAAELAAKKAAALKQLMDGEIDADAYAAVDTEVATLQADLIRDRTLAEANRQHAEATQRAQLNELQGHIRALMKESTGTAIDYAKDAAAQALFDNSLKLVGSDPANASMTAKEAVAAAHRMVKAYRGIVDAPAKAGAPAAPAPAPVARAVPPSLGGVPAAAPNNVSSDLRAQFNQLSGEDAEDFLARLPKPQRQALMTGGALV